MTADNRRSAFVALCDLASREHWCWHICCTTCGHGHFRYGFKELARGKHPDAPDWLVREVLSYSFTEKLGPVPRRGDLTWTIAQQEELAKYIAEASLGDIISVADSPEWLGYLGLGLLYCEDEEKKSRRITLALIPQLLARVPPSSEAHVLLDNILHGNLFLRWVHLETVEKAIRWW